RPEAPDPGPRLPRERPDGRRRSGGARARHGLLGRHREALELARSRAAGDDRRRGAPRKGGLAPRGRAAAWGAPNPRGDLGLEPPRADRARRSLERKRTPGAFEGDLSPRSGAPARALRRGGDRAFEPAPLRSRLGLP